MRPVKKPQSALRYPLNHLLGTEAGVRVLRVVMLSDIPIGVAELARLSGLQASGVARVCTRLEDLGAIEAVGRGTHGRQFRRNRRFALGDHLQSLFMGERAGAELIVQELQTAVRSAAPQPRAAWIEGAFAQGNDDPGDAIIVGVLVQTDRAATAREDLWRNLLPIQRERDVSLELRAMTMADLETANSRRKAELEQVQLLLGPPPLDLLPGAPPPAPASTRKRTHQDLDARSLRLARAIADRIATDPTIVEDARRYIERRVHSASPGERLELEEWRDLITTLSLPRLRRFLVSDTPRATRLRQSLPFLNVLSAEQRQAILGADQSA